MLAEKNEGTLLDHELENDLVKLEIQHGGNLSKASEQYGMAAQNWLDLSTGLNPYAYEIPQIPPRIFSELPYVNEDFTEAAKSYYGHDNLLAVNGTQMAIQALPKVLKNVGALLPSLGYQEHLMHWRQWGEVNGFYDSSDITKACEQIGSSIAQNPLQHLLMINPNNPSGLMFNADQINQWAQVLDDNCYVIVDEAFMDLTPQSSVLEAKMSDKVIVLRSFGKFFGLAGIRLGFVFANPKVLSKLKEHLGLWSVNGPAQYIATQAFKNKNWHQRTIKKITAVSLDYQALFEPLFSGNYFTVRNQVHSGLFSSYWLDEKIAKHLYDFFAMQGILLRYIPVNNQVCLIRIGLSVIENNDQVNRIKKAVKEYLNDYVIK